jgi:hypothetical protein
LAPRFVSSDPAKAERERQRFKKLVFAPVWKMGKGAVPHHDP